MSMPIADPPSAALRPLCAAQEVEDFGALRIVVEGLPPLAVFHAAGKFFVVDDTCSHGEASLSEGTVIGESIECPWHAGRFCLRTGAAETFPAVIPIRAYPVVLREGQVCIDSRSAAPSSL
jgi:nitrite reductase/ring-hydroxylating ferredoxin subunit